MNATRFTVTYMVWGYLVAAALYASYIAYLLAQKRRYEGGDDGDAG